MEDFGAGDLPREHFDQSGTSLRSEHLVQGTATRVGVDEQRAIARLGERERQVGRDE